MHIGIFADLEGSFGIWRMRQCRGGTAEWQYGRACLTHDINAVIEGAITGGATRVTVKDTHETGFNCLVDRLDKRARYIGGHFTHPTFFGNLAQYDLVFYVAIHAASGTAGAFFPHTHYGVFSQFLINGRQACEMDLYGGYLGEFGIPVGFISGEEVAVKQALQVLPWAKSVVVSKKREAYTSDQISLDFLQNGREELTAAARNAVLEAEKMRPLHLQGPLHFKTVFRSEELANRFNTWGFQQTGDTVEWNASTMIEGFEKLNQLTFFPKRIYPYRRPLSFIRRQLYRIKTSYFAPRPNPEGAVQPPFNGG